MKTLNDFPALEYSAGLVVYKKDLKAEAISRISGLEQGRRELINAPGTAEYENKLNAVIQEIVRFFNITDEELSQIKNDALSQETEVKEC